MCLTKKQWTEVNYNVFACFIDLRKTFDTVWHDGVFLKLHKPGKVYNVIESMYNDCRSILKCNIFSLTLFQ